MSAPAPAPTLARSTARGAVWNYATFLASKGLVLVSTLVLARLIAPEDFGLVALALVVMYHLDVINDFGLLSAVIWRKGDLEHTSRVAFGLTLGIGALLSGASLLLAPAVAAAYGEPAAGPLLAALSVTFLLASFGAVQDARIRRALAFRRRFVAELIKALAKTGVTIAMALAGFGAWALVHGQIVGVAVGALAYGVLARWRPRVALDRAEAGALLRYGSQVTLLGLLAVAASNVDYVVIGRRLGAEALGYYALAFRLPALLVLSSCSVLSQVLFPAFASINRDDGSLHHVLLRAVRALAALTVPMGLGIALVAPDLVTALFGPGWEPAVPVMRLLALYTVMSTLFYNDGDVYKAIGRPGLLNLVALGQVAVAVPVLWGLADLGLEAVALGQVLVAVVVLAVRLRLARSLLDVRPVDLLGALAPVLVGAAALGGAVLTVQWASRGMPVPVRLGASVVAGAVAYGAVLRRLDRPWTVEMLDHLGLARHRPGRSGLVSARHG